MSKLRVIEYQGSTILADSIQCVSPVEPSSLDWNFEIHFSIGPILEVHATTEKGANTEREIFVNLWKNAYVEI